MITSNFIHRVFHIRCGAKTGTAFTVDVDRRQYLITARHNIPEFNASGIDVLSNGKWSGIDARLVGHGSGLVDISVVAPRFRLTPTDLPIEVTSEGLTYGQGVYFLGFPYGMQGSVIFGEKGFPMPLVKRALMSAFAGDVFLLDGHNNPGFSGGPVIFGKPGRQVTHLGAVVASYSAVHEPVFEQGEKTDLTYRYNTGIIHSYKIELALDLIRANPIGVPLD